ncbi:alpha/beta hydrolase [Bradyrhizobium sp. CIAT3101]|uniref:alpha/beta fold hydrolase n=1 Tax=Bradyrhizobium sp. CIAT3101 TaxID=439387 RepID=UPI0024B0A17B|nr:alpha/beta hydrolase [Bradyrhizobium sp. CIAT3101]WFU78183.1 alpha/beta hydrolase [Bradyrhizobium sp. CIAT3101]
MSGRAILAADVVGNGAPVVFLHAGVADRRMWSAQLAAIGTRARAIAYDRRGFGDTSAEIEDFSAVADLVRVIDDVAGGSPAILVACSQGGRIALDIALEHPTYVRGLVLIAPSVSGSPEPVYPPEIRRLIEQVREAEQVGDLNQANAVKAHLWLDGPFQPEGRVAGDARRLFLEMNGQALRPSSVGSSVDATSAYRRLGEISAPSLVIWGDLDFPNIRDRSRYLTTALPNASGHELSGTAHLPSLDRPAEVSALIAEFVDRHLGGLS